MGLRAKTGKRGRSDSESPREGSESRRFGVVAGIRAGAANVAVVVFVHAVAGIIGVAVIHSAVVGRRSGDGIDALLVPLAAVIPLVGRIHVASVAEGWTDCEFDSV